MLLKCCTQCASKFGKLSSGHRTGKSHFSCQSQRKSMLKNAQTIAQLHSFHTLKVMLKILQAWLQQYVNQELPDVQARFRKGRGTRDQIANIHWIMEKTREFQKNIYFCFLTMPKPLTVWITIRSVQFSCSVVSNSLRPHESQHARLPCPSPSPGVHSDSRSSSH